MAALGRLFFAERVVTAGLALLPRFPAYSVAKLVLDRAGDANTPKKEIVAKVEAVARKHAVVRRALDVWAKKQPARIALALARTTRPKSLEDLTKTQQRQLARVGEGLAIHERVGEGLATHELVAGKRRAYDVFVYGADDGCVFVSDTTEVVAELVQAGVECDDPALKEALYSALRL